jgi:hypothetical protein
LVENEPLGRAHGAGRTHQLPEGAVPHALHTQL